MTDIRLNCKFIISHIHVYALCNVHSTSTWNDIKNIPSHLLPFSQPIQKWASETHESWALLFVVPYTWHSWMPFISISSKTTNMCSQHNQKKIRAKWKISSSSHSLCDYCKPINLLVMFLRNCCSFPPSSPLLRHYHYISKQRRRPKFSYTKACT